LLKAMIYSIQDETSTWWRLTYRGKQRKRATHEGAGSVSFRVLVDSQAVIETDAVRQLCERGDIWTSFLPHPTLAVKIC
jgi:hypothetical protein